MGSTVENSEMQLPFPHGIEVELQVIRKDGTWIRGEEILQVFDEIVSSAKGLLEKKIRSSILESVKRKYKQSAQTEEGERGSRIVVTYEDPNDVEFDVEGIKFLLSTTIYIPLVLLYN